MLAIVLYLHDLILQLQTGGQQSMESDGEAIGSWGVTESVLNRHCPPPPPPLTMPC
jgi:hypothetical protein